MLCSIQLPKETEKWTIKVSYVCLYSNTCFRLQNGSIRPELDHIFIRLGPAPPTPPSLSSYPTRVMDSLCGSCVLLLRWLVVRPLPPPPFGFPCFLCLQAPGRPGPWGLVLSPALVGCIWFLSHFKPRWGLHSYPTRTCVGTLLYWKSLWQYPVKIAYIKVDITFIIPRLIDGVPSHAKGAWWLKWPGA